MLLAPHDRTTVSSLTAVHSEDKPSGWRTGWQFPSSRTPDSHWQSVSSVGRPHALPSPTVYRRKNIDVQLLALPQCAGSLLPKPQQWRSALQQTDTQTWAGSAAAYSDSFLCTDASERVGQSLISVSGSSEVGLHAYRCCGSTGRVTLTQTLIASQSDCALLFAR